MSEDYGYYTIINDPQMDHLLNSFLTEIDISKGKHALNQGAIACSIINALVTVGACYKSKEELLEYQHICEEWLKICFNEMFEQMRRQAFYE